MFKTSGLFLYKLKFLESQVGVAAGTEARLPFVTQTSAVTGGWGSICADLFSPQFPVGKLSVGIRDMKHSSRACAPFARVTGFQYRQSSGKSQ
jgi:hypothetical protein